ncbi:MAG: ABC transporter ATP-binding protein [Candidatus Sumerlaeota bacterium]|nr:ABC transporter ATP-binding protein [Candidatus Sumerlaeota bacterium]
MKRQKEGGKPIQAVRGVSLEAREGEIVTLIGANGAGKSSILRAICGAAPCRGSIVFNGAELRGRPVYVIVGLGIAHVPEGRGIFGDLTVMENLRLAAWRRNDAAEIARDYDRVFSIFPRLAERRRQPAGTLSGGEQQMLALGRGLMMRARLMLLDEPSMGLSPVLARDIFRVLADINRQGMTMLLVEQNARMALRLASRAYVLETGRIILEGPSRDLSDNPRVKEAYLGG